MNASELCRSILRDKNLREYGDLAGRLPFLDDHELHDHLEERSSLLDKASRLGALTCYNGTKIDCRSLSPGCIACAEGTWSCLFINGICNARCFYCPSEQKEPGLPVTNTLEFPDPREYIAYLERFGFTGVSISGGEPLLSFERSLRYIAAIRRHFGNRMYIWLYTNGILLTREKLEKLKDSGLDEIRFDIGATGYKTDKPEMAAGIIPVVTVEIPAIPEDHDRVNDLIPKLAAAGVKHLNLHQLRLTEFNAPQLLKRGYKFIRGNKITVAGSEITALKLLAGVLEQKKDLPVNYCSFVYKNRFQGRAARLRTASIACRPWEDITAAGYIRSLFISGDEDVLKGLAEKLENAGEVSGGWQLSGQGRQLFIRSPLLDITGVPGPAALNIRYYDTRFTGAVTYRYPYTEIRLTGRRKLFVERIQCLADYPAAGAERELFTRLFPGDSFMGRVNSGDTGVFPGANSKVAGISPADEFSMIDALGLPAGKKETWLKILDFERPGMGFQEW